MAKRRPLRQILGKKLRMTQIFREDGRLVAVTVIAAGPCTVLQVKTPERDGYSALQVGFDDTKKRAGKPKKPQAAVFDKLNVPPKRFVREISAVEGLPREPGATIGVGILKDVPHVDVTGITKGRGYSGTVKRWGFTLGAKTHGCKNIREPGSVGSGGSDPGKIGKGKKLPGQHGNARRTVQNLEVLQVLEEENLLLVRGAVPGPTGGYVIVSEAVKGGRVKAAGEGQGDEGAGK
ncbi:MAG: 50S ribosomal protein L3 [Planctomycetes bacterium]|nr:50S ribosomal protein L3 [Planctomycetota bacterium]